MASKRELRIIARNLIAKSALSAQFDPDGTLNEKDRERLNDEVSSVAYSIVKKTYKSDKWTTPEIVKDVLNHTNR